MLLDLPDELLIRCLAGAGGKGVCRAASACRRLQMLTRVLSQQPIFSSAMSTEEILKDAITDATHRALEGVWGECVIYLLLSYLNPQMLAVNGR